MTQSNDYVRPGRAFPGVGVGAIVRWGGHLLMVQRAGAHGAGTWSVPGGWVDMWEDPMHAAEREVWEETGLVVQARKPLGWTDSPFPNENIHAVTLWIECSFDSSHGEANTIRVTEPDKCPKVEWVPLKAVAARSLFHPLNRWWWEHPQLALIDGTGAEK